MRIGLDENDVAIDRRGGKRRGADRYVVDVASNYADVAARWRMLRDSGVCLAFQEETWLSSWYRELGVGEDITPLLATFVDSASGADVLALPLVRRREGGLTFIEFADRGLTDYNAPIIGVVDVHHGEAMNSLRRMLPRADMIRFTKMPALVGVRPNPFADAPGARPCDLGGNILRAPERWDDWHWGLERTFRKELERSWRVFERRGGEFSRVVDRVEARAVFAQIKAQQSRRIRELGLEYTLDEPHNEAFYDRLLDTGLESGEVMLTMLGARGELVAGLLGVANGKHYSMVRLSTAAGEWTNCSPGRLVIERTMRHLHAEGYRTFDFTIGDYAYKRRMGVERVPLIDLHLALSWRGWPKVMDSRARAVARANPRLLAVARVGRRLANAARSLAVKSS